MDPSLGRGPHRPVDDAEPLRSRCAGPLFGHRDASSGFFITLLGGHDVDRSPAALPAPIDSASVADRGSLEGARAAFEARAWASAAEALRAADAAEPLDPDDLHRLAVALGLSGRDDEATETWARAYHGYFERNEPLRACRAAFWLGLGAIQRGDHALGGGWLARANKILDAVEDECAEHGYLLLPQGIPMLMRGAAEEALGVFDRMSAIGDRCGDADLIAFGGLGRGQALVHLGRTDEGLACLDEVMVALTAGEISAVATGMIYCASIECFLSIFDLGRVREWTDALTAWTSTQPDLVPFRGQCLVYRAEMMTMRGAWLDALDEAEAARVRLSEPPHPAIGMAYYQLGELHRLRGQHEKAEEAYRRANQAGHPPEPGLPLLWVAAGKIDAARSAIERAVAAAGEHGAHLRLLPARVEILLAAGQIDDARAAAADLDALVPRFPTPMVLASAAQARASVQLASGDTQGASEAAQTAWSIWRELDAPYEAARCRAIIADACSALGDEESAALERDAARRTFTELGAASELARLDPGPTRTPSTPGSGLTARELEVLSLVATGKTNKMIAATLVVSEKTIARHVSNIFMKLGVASRAEATAYAFINGLT